MATIVSHGEHWTRIMAYEVREIIYKRVQETMGIAPMPPNSMEYCSKVSFWGLSGATSGLHIYYNLTWLINRPTSTASIRVNHLWNHFKIPDSSITYTFRPRLFKKLPLTTPCQRTCESSTKIETMLILPSFLDFREVSKGSTSPTARI